MNRPDGLDRTLIDWLAEEGPRDTSRGSPAPLSARPAHPGAPARCLPSCSH